MEPTVLIDSSGSGAFVVEIAGHHAEPARADFADRVHGKRLVGVVIDHLDFSARQRPADGGYPIGMRIIG